MELILKIYTLSLLIVVKTDVLRDGGSGYKTYVFKEFTRRCAIDRKGRGRKEVIYLRVADVSCTQDNVLATQTRQPPTRDSARAS